MSEDEKWLRKSTGKCDISQVMYTLYCWSMTDAYPAIQQGFVEGLATLDAKLAAEEDDDEGTKADLTSQVYPDTFGEVVKPMTEMQLPAFCNILQAAGSLPR